MIFFLFLVTVEVKVHALFIHLVVLFSYRSKFLQIICVLEMVTRFISEEGLSS